MRLTFHPRFSLVAKALIGSLSLIACHETTSTPQPAPTMLESKHAPLILTEADHDKIIGAAVGQTITLKLSDNPSTGYHWVEVKGTASGVLSAVQQSSVFPQVPAGFVGVSGELHLKYQALQPGRQKVQWALYPPGANRPMDHLVTVTIVVR